MADGSTLEQKPKIKTVKTYAAAIGIFLVVNFCFETGVSALENSTHQWLYPIFPFTRVGLFLIMILVASYNLRRRTSRPKPRLWWRIVKLILLVLIAYGLTMGAWLSVSQADADRASANAQSYLD